MKQDRRQFSAVVTPTELDAVKAAAARRGQSVSEFVRYVALEAAATSALELRVEATLTGFRPT